jgi:hypothetical protein
MASLEKARLDMFFSSLQIGPSKIFLKIQIKIKNHNKKGWLQSFN